MPGLLRGIARTVVIAGTVTAVSVRVSRRQAGRRAQQEQVQAYQQQLAAGEPVPVRDVPSKLTMLQNLGRLKEKGVLTEAEFQEERARILAS